MQQYVIKDCRGKDFTIRKVGNNDYKITFYHYYNREYRAAIYTREQLQRKTIRNDCMFRQEILRCFEEGILDKLVTSTEYDDSMRYMMLVIDSFSNLRQVLSGGEIIYVLNEADGNMLKARIDKLAKILGIKDGAQVYRELRRNNDECKIFANYYGDNIESIDVE